MPSVIQWTDHSDQATTLECDVVVVGSGAGGAVSAAELAEGGAKVVLLEEGPWVRTADFNHQNGLMLKKLYRDMGTTMIFGPPHIAFAEGEVVGGSTTVNGGMSWRTPEKILGDWVAEGLTDLTPEGMAPWFERVERRVGVARQIPSSIGGDSEIMRKGASALKLDWIENTRNQVACVGTNNCGFGCPTGAKQSMLVTYVPRALAAGATLLTDTRAHRVIVENGRAVGVQARVKDPRTRRFFHNVTVRAKRVILSCGAVQTPLLLLRQGIANRSKQLGNNFLCHPNAKVVALFDHDVNGWQGVSQGQQVRQYQDEGIMIAENFIPPSFFAMSQLGTGDAIWSSMLRYHQAVAAACLIEDSTTGTVRPGPFGSPLVRYRFTQADADRTVGGLTTLCRMMFAAGAEKVVLPFAEPHTLESEADLRQLADARIKPRDFELFTVHLMGTCRMGTDPSTSVLDEFGQSHDVPGLYVADASVFPTAIGVNPQITIMALATRAAHRMLERLNA